ncbi:MAG: hypothetical protein JWO22_2348 [Frankiales bacterium]|nr:hypothetical protein [Frankiales bacterium]
MRGADLLGLPVVGPGGEDLGRVLDVRLVQDGPILGAFAALRIEGLVVGRRALAARLGYDRYDAQGPWLVAAGVARLTRGTRYLPWADLQLTDGEVRSQVADLGPVPKIA